MNPARGDAAVVSLEKSTLAKEMATDEWRHYVIVVQNSERKITCACGASGRAQLGQFGCTKSGCKILAVL